MTAAGSPPFVVTTVRNPGAPARARAHEVARRTGARLVERPGAFESLFDTYDVEHVYVCKKDRDEVRRRDGQRLFVHPGLYAQKRGRGVRYPLVDAALGTESSADPVRSVLDCTLGLAGDALVLAGALEAAVTGLEYSPVLFSLLEEGLARLARPHPQKGAMAWQDAAARVRPVASDALTFLAAQAGARFDVVYLDPMMTRPLGQNPMFEVLRAFAHPAPVSQTLLVEAARVARRRVVLKLPHDTLAPPDALRWDRTVTGSAVDYFVHNTSNLEF